MGHRTSRLFGCTLVCAVLACAFVLALPGSASAADAKVYTKRPVVSSTVNTATPKVSVYIIDRYGIKGSSNFRLYLDGTRRYPKISYRSRYKKVTLTYQAPKLSKARHKVTVKVKNVKGHWSTTYWYFTVPDLTPPRIPMPVTIESAECSSCHLGYPTTHPTDDCGFCHGTGRPVPGAAYTPLSASAHTLACSQQVCHRVATVFPHVVSSDCDTCHNGAFTGIAASHDTTATEPPHVSTSTWCAQQGCHDISLTVEHYRWTIYGERLSCETCHASIEPRVIAALRAGSTACEACHDVGAVHTASTRSHNLASVPSCVAASCHIGGLSVASIHAPLGGCADCHGIGKTPSLVCTNCHVSDGHPPHSASPAPAAIRIGGVDFGMHACSECHAVGDLRVLHGGANGCDTCHPGAADTVLPWNGTCVQGACHAAGTSSAVHAGIDGAHVLSATPACATTGCHSGGRNVASIHASGPGCAACHAPGVTASVVCSTAGCHPAAATARHSSHPSSVSSATITISGVSYGTHRCSECHATTELQAVHGGAASSCSKCHPSPRDTFAAWNGTCVQGGCHAPGGPLAMHGGADAAHTTSSASGCTIAGCHSGGASVAAIHASVPGRSDAGCGICHGRAGGPTLACGTSGCHAANTTALHASHPATITSVTISINGVSYGKHSCSECHVTTELQAAHGGASGCSKCHPSPRSSIGTYSGGCVQGDCHKTGTTLAMHGDVNAAHTTASAAACTVSGCHTGGSDVAVIHAAAGGCPVCHAPGKTPTLVCATTGCHSASTTAKHSSHPASVTSSTISILGTSYGNHLCSECHATTELQSVHGGGSSCSKCHPSPRNSFTTYGGGCVQGTCHKTGTTLAMHGSIDATHTAPAGACVKSGCHGSNVAALHAPGPGCAACHGAGKTTTLACGTAGCHTSDPHPPHASAVTSMTVTIGGISFGKHLCSECHASTDLRDLHGGSSGCGTCHPSPRNTFTKWNATCVQGSCHAPASATSLHGRIDVGHSAPTGACVKSGCHGANVAVLHAPGPGCAACHATGKTLTLVCGTAGCHPSGASAIHAAHPARITSATIQINGTSYGSHLCSECHATTELQAVHGGGSNCAKCHPSPRNSFATYGGGCVQGACHQAGTGLAMHGGADAAHIAAAAGSCTLTGCHAGGTDVAKVHAGQGCATCHALGRTPTLVCATAGCHPSGASPLHTAHPTTITSSTITINGTSYGKHLCTECHAPMELQALHGGSDSCPKCHPSPRDTIVTYSGSCSQGMCHSISSGRRAHAAIDSGHNAPVQPSCTLGACHTGGSDVAKIHALKGGCAACHGVNRTPTLVCSTCHSGDLSTVHAPYIGTKHTIALGTCATSSCHTEGDAALLHGGGDGCADCHGTGKTPSLVCANCHAGTATTVHAPYIGTKHDVVRPTCQAPVCHGTDAAGLHPRTGCAACHAASKTPSLECSTCHTADVVTYHPTGTLGHTVNQHPCTGSSCHGGNAATTHAHSDSTCMACHTNADGTADTNACYVGSGGGCHPLPWATRHSNYAITSDYHGAAVGDGTGGGMYDSLGWILPPYTRGANLACSVCHDTAGTSNIHEIKTTINGRAVTVTNGYQLVNACVACHGGTVNDWHQGCIDCHSGGMGGANARDFNGTDCSACHQHGMQGWQHGQFITTGPTM